MDIQQIIIQYVKQHGQATSKQLLQDLGLPRSSVLKHLGKLADIGQLIKIGAPPKEVVYKLPNVSALPEPTAPANAPLPPAQSIEPVKSPEKGEETKQEPGPDASLACQPGQAVGAGFWAGVLARFKIDAELVKKRAQAIGNFFDPLYDQWETFRGMHQSSYLLSYVRRICGSIIWVMALVSVLVYRGGPSGVIASPANGGTKQSVKIQEIASSLGSAPRKDTIGTVVRIAILLLIGGIIGYQIHHVRPGHNEVDLANQLEKTQKELSDTQFALSETKAQFSQLDYRSKDLQEALGNAQANAKALNDQIYQKDRQISKLEQEKEYVSNQSQQQTQTLQQRIDYLQEQNRLGQAPTVPSGQEQAKKDRAEIERLNDKGGQLNSTVPISYIPMNQIIAWSSQGVPSDEIINRIKSSHSAYWLTASDLTWLRQHAVNEEVIQVMANSGPLRDNASPQSQSHPVKKILGWVEKKININR